MRPSIWATTIRMLPMSVVTGVRRTHSGHSEASSFKLQTLKSRRRYSWVLIVVTTISSVGVRSG
jgi:hypothetical protein